MRFLLDERWDLGWGGVGRPAVTPDISAGIISSMMDYFKKTGVFFDSAPIS